jgi:hypothetical protein
VRVGYSTLTKEALAGPWLQAMWRKGRVDVKAAAGLYPQFPEFDQVLGASGNPSLEAERARHLDAAIGTAFAGLRWQASVYHRRERDMVRLEDSEPRAEPRATVAVEQLRGAERSRAVVGAVHARPADGGHRRRGDTRHGIQPVRDRLARRVLSAVSRPVRERLQMRFEAIDGLDRTVLWNPNIDPRNANFGFINQDRNNPRDLQIGVRFTF